MNNSSQCIFDLSHVLRNLRDTFEFLLPKEVDSKAYDQRKKVLQSVQNDTSFIGKFIANNADKLKDFTDKYNEFMEEVYGDNSTILMRKDDTVRVDHTQHIKVFDYVIYLSETLRDIFYSHVNFAAQQNMSEKIITDLLPIEERFDRILKAFLLLQDYQKSFAEFQKVMGESKGQPTPQSNYIVQNELSKMAAMIRFNRSHTHATDNKTLDMLDRVNQLVEMTEGRRERRDNKPFSDFFKESISELGQYFNELVPQYQNLYDICLKEMLETIRNNEQNNKDNQA